ncbi:sensor histidine kinase [Sinorhizobium fredii]|uniref:sensor histidine kinase n=1 Tax=Rhizobium fredii TaxID=380 RepID=UPI0004B0E026|nr:sensor histidine kinase [Sinorhizobium fredii]
MRASRAFIHRAFDLSNWRYMSDPLDHAMRSIRARTHARFQSEPGVAIGRKTWINTFRARSDKVIAIGRIMAAIGSLVIAWLEAANPAFGSELVLAVLAAYLCYAVIAAFRVLNAEISRVRGTLIRHVIDVTVFVVLVFLTQRVSGPFFIFMPLLLLSATLHWRWRGALWTAVVCLAVLLYAMISDTAVLSDPDVGAAIELSRILFVAMAATVLIWLGSHQEAVRAELLRLVERAPALPDGREWPAAAALDYAAHVMCVPRALLIWSDGEEPWTNLAVWENGAMHNKRLPPDAYLPWTAAALQRASLLITDAKRARLLIHRGDGRFERWTDDASPILPALVADFSIDSAVSVQFHVNDLEARLFLLDPPTPTLDDVAVAEIIADRLKALFEQAILVRRLSDAAALEERLRIGRDLHDGVLQSLAGTALHLQALRSSAGIAPEELDRRLVAIQAMLADEQRDLRTFIHALEPGRNDHHSGHSQLARQFNALAYRLRNQWSIDFHFVLDPVDLHLPATMVYELTRMTSEATANAVRHGAARTLNVSLRLDAGAILLAVNDDGRGFGFDRRVEHAELESGKFGPRSLRERVAAHGGQLTIDRVEQWTRIIISIPTHR